MEIPPNISKDDLLRAIKKIDKESIPSNAHSSTYDVVYKGKKYPPKLVVSYANLFANGKILNRNEFKGGAEQPCFIFLKQYGFEIVKKNGEPISIKDDSFYTEFLKFLKQTKTGNLKTKHYMPFYKGLKVKVSFGQGVSAKIPWISFLIPPNTTSEGIYPVILYYKNIEKVILSYGLSETKEPIKDWNLDDNIKTIHGYFLENDFGLPDRYGDSFVYKVYDTQSLPKVPEFEQDLELLIDSYKKVDSQKKKDKIKGIKESVNEGMSTKKQIKLSSNKFNQDSITSGLRFSNILTDRFISSLCTKPFVILTGLSGSGKTKLAEAFARWICYSEDQYCIVPVGADWTNREPLLGYSNAIEPDKYVKPENRILDILIEAEKELHKPYFIILDEMNLSHVERYFADFLSIMETGKEITLFEADESKSGVPPRVSWPKNVFIIGTVNIDETTYMFSPKVLDRANTIEFRIDVEEMELFLEANTKPDLSLLEGKGASMAQNFLEISSGLTFENPGDSVNETLLDFFKELKKSGAEFGYRSASEIHQLLHNLKIINPEMSINQNLDIAIMQKLLPKLHGSRRKLVPILKTLGEFCLIQPTENIEKDILSQVGYNFNDEEKVKYPLTLEKLSRMYNGVIENGFASYAEA
ncbi:MrcB family domain-containing protein [Leeuwenhoekiella aestuarii]|uniref:5-methylcytosine-specific restriction protein B n=1 Tax=Leeuwenhoekiella aestuarii TaxID=2249426 RepID=A0A4Q0NUU2_9FLAO|nr:DUF3578 domain-containing protein [Leeuwenhoekiella aestuarii]RXG14373.1 5-methylcytosine-specific restriction protein B [Leeuwenhoekiella aestuarii]